MHTYHRRAAEQRDEIAALHSITSSARASSVGGSEVERLGAVQIASSNFCLFSVLIGRLSGT
jgi:hypothetical protein